MIDVILSPDLRLLEQQEQNKLERNKSREKYKIGDTVKAGTNGKPGILTGISNNGFASIKWPCGSVLSGVELNRLVKLHGAL